MHFFINIICLGIPVRTLRRYVRTKLKQGWDCYRNKPSIITRHMTQSPVILWFDHILGGGTEVYSKRQFKILNKQYNVLRIQYVPAKKTYHLTHTKNRHWVFKTDNLDTLFEICSSMKVQKIVINNLVGYKNIKDVFNFTLGLKTKITPTPHVSMHGHDFHCICPSFNLINSDGVYCNMKYCDGCEKCWSRKQLAPNRETHNALKSGATTILDWRQTWEKFLITTVDSVVVFSEKIAEIFTSAYPGIKKKITVIPHSVRKYKNVTIKPHDEINIAVLGTISQHKGADVIRKMAQHMPNDINIKIIGTMKDAPENIFVYGKYNPRKLPRIMKKHKIDLVFIPSIWPETFSYTTSEAISMGLPVACFNMGAPAERVSKYSCGLILNEISPQKNLAQIIDFIKTQRAKK